jgi:hypothetical protein
MRLQLISAVVLSLAACGGSSSQVPVKGTDSQVISLAGTWEGEYKGDESGRSGPITFTLTVGRHTAEGTVVMNNQTPLQIKFVELEGGGGVSGTIEAYTDPGCNCQVETQFSGQRVNERIDGTFTTKALESGQTQHGTWGVARTSK